MQPTLASLARRLDAATLLPGVAKRDHPARRGEGSQAVQRRHRRDPAGERPDDGRWRAAAGGCCWTSWKRDMDPASITSRRVITRLARTSRQVSIPVIISLMISRRDLLAQLAMAGAAAEVRARRSVRADADRRAALRQGKTDRPLDAAARLRNAGGAARFVHHAERPVLRAIAHAGAAGRCRDVVAEDRRRGQLADLAVARRDQEAAGRDRSRRRSSAPATAARSSSRRWPASSGRRAPSARRASPARACPTC